MNRLEEENECYKDRNGVDIGQMTPRPDWAELRDRYPSTIEITNGIYFSQIETESTCLRIEKILYKSKEEDHLHGKNKKKKKLNIK